VRSLVELALWAHAAVEITSRSTKRKEVLMIGLPEAPLATGSHTLRAPTLKSAPFVLF